MARELLTHEIELVAGAAGVTGGGNTGAGNITALVHGNASFHRLPALDHSNTTQVKPGLGVITSVDARTRT